MSKKVVIVGAGASGLCAIKCCLDEGLQPFCYERSEEIGGLWNYNDKVTEGQACVMKTTVINTSKEMMCYSDFPVPKTFPIFMHNSKVMDYYRQYMTHFHLEQHIYYQQEIVSIVQAQDYEETGKWIVVVKDLKTGITQHLDFDGVLVCTGHHADTYLPEVSGMQDFEGRLIHSHQYRSHTGFEDKKVVIVGLGNSGGDLAVDLSKIAREVFVSTRHGAWVFNKMGPGGAPIDLTVTTRFGRLFPPSLIQSMVQAQLNKRMDHSRFGLKPAHGVFDSHPMVNDDLPNRIVCGSVVIKPGLKCITKTGVVFTDDSTVDDVDVIVFATGYKFGFPFIKHPALEVKDNRAEFYKYCFPPELSKGTLALIGFVQPIGSTVPISELQCRWATRVIKGVTKLPVREGMWADVREKQKLMAARYTASHRHTIQVDWIPFMDELAEHVGCRPHIKKMLMGDPRLAMTCFFGPCTPLQYRLEGPGAWGGARQALMEVWDRTYYPHCTRSAATDSSKYSLIKPIIFVILAAVFIKFILGLILN